MNQPKRVSIKELRDLINGTEAEIEETVAELNRMVPPDVRAKYGEDYELVTLHTDETTGERYALLHATIEVRDS